jgi:AGCS family alanine or glycine:cation symporter
MWGLPLLLLLIGGGIFFLLFSKGISFRYIFHAVNILRGKYDNVEDDGEISHFQALSTALASTIGMGNIAGVAVAISIGGPGAIFWMWVSALIGMCTKFFTCSLSIMYRGKDSRGELQGGPMYFITEGLGARWKPLAVIFSLAGLIGSLPIFNVNQLTQAIRDIVLKPSGLQVGMQTDIITGIIITLLTSIVILGGLQRISRTTERLVPAMVILYFVSVIIILGLHWEDVPTYLSLIFTEAFSASLYKGEPLLGGALGGLILLGIRRGAFSNEAGIGTAPMAHGAAKTNEAIREGLVAMIGPFVDTIIVCTLTALAILVTGVWETTDNNGVSLTASAFSESLPIGGSWVLMVCIAFFSISSLFSFSYYGTKCLGFLIGAEKKHYYNYFYLGSILFASIASLEMMINLIDGFYAVMAFPTMIASLILAPKVMNEARKYFAKINQL